MKRISIIAAAAVAAGAGLFVYHRHDSPASASVATPAVPVTTTQPRYQDVPVWLSAVGSVQPLQAVTVKVRVDGQLDRVAFTEGTDVRRNALLAQVDPRPYKAQLDLAVANLAKDQAQLDDTKVNLARFEKLASIGAAPSQNVDALRAQVAQLEAAAQGDRAMLDTARVNLDFTTVRSPLDGRVGMRLVDRGTIVHASDPNGLVTVTQMDPIAVVFALPQDELPAVLDAKGTLAVDAWTRDGGQRIGRGELAVIDSQIDPTTGQVRLKAMFSNAQRTLWPGEFVAVRILMRTEQHALVVPSRAVQRGPSGLYVYVVGANATVAPRPVTVGTTSDGSTMVMSGLAPTDTVVVAGQARIAPGTRVAATAGAQ